MLGSSLTLAEEGAILMVAHQIDVGMKRII